MVHCQWKRVTYSFWQNIDGFRVCRDTVHGHGLGLSPDDNSRLDPVDSLVIGSTSACCAVSNDAFVSRTGNIRKRPNCRLNSGLGCLSIRTLAYEEKMKGKNRL